MKKITEDEKLWRLTGLVNDDTKDIELTIDSLDKVKNCIIDNFESNDFKELLPICVFILQNKNDLSNFDPVKDSLDFYKLIKEDHLEELLINPLNWVGEIFSMLNK